MAFNRKNWQDNVSDITAAELNRIEQGIYDNSLVVDAITNTIKPRDTETYKTAELTEGQITDVIGVNDILIKGQTSQNGEPTPSSPVDVNVVSGSNVVNTSNKNLLNINNAIAFRACTIQLQNNSIKIITDGTNNAIVKIPCVLTAGNYYLHFEGNANIVNVAFYNSNGEKIIANNPSSSKAITLSDNLAYININLSNVAGTYTLTFNKLYINLGSTDLGYEPHQGKELPLDLPVENLFDKSLITSTSSSIKYIPIQCQANTDYTLSTNNVASSTNTNLFLSTQDSGVTSANNGAYINSPRTINSGNNTTIYVGYRNDLSNNWIQLEKGSSASPYHPYGTDPIELCKIGNYQDYFYRSGSKWYLHKEIEKVILDGSESNFSTVSSSGSYYRISLLNVNNIKNFGSQRTTNIFINNFSKSTVDNYNSVFQYEDDIYFYLPEGMSTKQAFVDLLSSTNSVLYYVLNNTTDTEITNTTLISQLEAIYNAPLYEQTNITQTNNDLPMVLDITACKDNINGIKAFIRK